MSDAFKQENPPGPTEDDLLTNLFQYSISRITGIVGELVRPAWQRIPPRQPEALENWAAISIMSREPVEYVYLTPDTDETLQLQRHEYLYLMAMFYGPDAEKYAGVLRDGFAIPNNWWYLNEYGIRYYDVGETIVVPYNTNNQYLGRCDLPFTTVRQLNRQYPIPTLLQSSGTIVTEQLTIPWSTPIPT